MPGAISPSGRVTSQSLQWLPDRSLSSELKGILNVNWLSYSLMKSTDFFKELSVERLLSVHHQVQFSWLIHKTEFDLKVLKMCQSVCFLQA